jgi:DNA-cytosine methyltransferase
MAPKTPVPKPTAHVRKTLRYGSDFAGLGTCGIAMQKCCKKVDGLKALHEFSCDKARFSKKLIMQADPPLKFYDDVLNRTMDPATRQLDLYTFTSPCQGLSAAGLQRGVEDPRTRLALHGVAFITEKKPKSFIMEQVATLASHAKNKEYFAFLQKALSDTGYVVMWRILNSKHYVAQNRPRLYMIGIRKDRVRTQTRGIPLFPEPPNENDVASLKSIVTPLPTAQWRPHPPRNKSGHYKNVMKAYTMVQENVNPFIIPVVIDYKSSEQYASYMVGRCPTLTRTRSSQFGYWCSVKGGPLDVDEMAKLQGFAPEDLPWREAGLSATAVAGALGNGQTLPLVCDLIPNVLFHASSIDLCEFQLMKAP